MVLPSQSLTLSESEGSKLFQGACRVSKGTSGSSFVSTRAWKLATSKVTEAPEVRFHTFQSASVVVACMATSGVKVQPLAAAVSATSWLPRRRGT